MRNKKVESNIKRISRYGSLIICFLLTSYTVGADTTSLPEDLVVVRSQPAVFMVLAKGDIEVTYPKKVSIKINWDIAIDLQKGAVHFKTLLENEYERDLRDGIIPYTKSRADYYWEKITENPDKYLEADEKETQLFKNTYYSYGTGFAISREGILLTNAHVVADPSGGILPPELHEQLILNTINNLSSEFNGRPTEAIFPQLILSLDQWFAKYSVVKGKFKQAEVVLKFDTDPVKSNYLRSRGYFILPFQREPLTVFARVLAKGEPIPGKDVAVLKVGLKEGEAITPRERLIDKVSGKLTSMEDKLICLPLGDSDDVLPGSRIQAMGFPGAAFNPQLMPPEAEFLVGSQDGQIGQIKPMLGNWSAFEMTALIHYGSSGGPVLNKEGNVIGLNVGSADPRVAGRTLAVPINVAKEFLKRAGIYPDPGPLTHLWVEGLKLYSGGHYDEALKKFEEVYNMQRGPHTTTTARETNPYVEKMITSCKKKLGLVP